MFSFSQLLKEMKQFPLLLTFKWYANSVQNQKSTIFEGLPFAWVFFLNFLYRHHNVKNERKNKNLILPSVFAISINGGLAWIHIFWPFFEIKPVLPKMRQSFLKLTTNNCLSKFQITNEPFWLATFKINFYLDLE